MENSGVDGELMDDLLGLARQRRASAVEEGLEKGGEEGGFPLLEIHRQHTGTSKPKKCDMRRSFLRYASINSRIHSVRVEYAPWLIEGPMLLKQKSILPSASS